MHPCCMERLAVVRHVVIGMTHAPFESFQLQRLQFIAAGALDRLQLVGVGSALNHCLLHRYHGATCKGGGRGDYETAGAGQRWERLWTTRKRLATNAASDSDALAAGLAP